MMTSDLPAVVERYAKHMTSTTFDSPYFRGIKGEDQAGWRAAFVKKEADESLLARAYVELMKREETT